MHEFGLSLLCNFLKICNSNVTFQFILQLATGSRYCQWFCSEFIMLF